MASSRPFRRYLLALLAALLVVLAPALAGGAPAMADETPAPVDPAATAPATTAPVAPTDPAATTAEPAATTVAPAEPIALGTRTLRLGDTGSDVSELQKLLKVERTGTFDAATKKAVKRVQRAAGIKANGVVAKKTLKAIKRAARDKASSSRAMPRAGAPAASQRYARAYIASKYGWGSGQMSCLKALWTRESGWRYWVSNPNGIYRGIPQTSSRVWGALGYSTAQYMRSPEVQIKVGTHYIKKRYGTPCNAWAFWRSHHWY
jgi:peptidoglycan hydrolase-like protein with peptidoglycan-binding domain